LGRQVVDLIRLHFLDDSDQVGGIRQVAVVQDEVAVGNIRALIKMIDPVGVEQRGAAFYAVHLVALGQQEFGQVGPVLPGNAGDERDALGCHMLAPSSGQHLGAILT